MSYNYMDSQLDSFSANDQIYIKLDNRLDHQTNWITLDEASAKAIKDFIISKLPNI